MVRRAPQIVCCSQFPRNPCSHDPGSAGERQPTSYARSNSYGSSDGLSARLSQLAALVLDEVIQIAAVGIERSKEPLLWFSGC